MGKLNMFGVSLSHPKGVYYAGQWLQGYVCVEITAPMKMRGIRLTFYGGCKVSFREESNTMQHNKTGPQRKDYTLYRGTEKYFDHTMYIYGAPDPSLLASNSPTLDAGRYHYPFQFLLPAWSPSSFEGSAGDVRYWVKAVIDKPWKHDHTTKRMFTVMGITDLNKIEDAPKPAELQGEKTICCMCCASGPVGANLKLERSGYVPGESICLTGEIINNSGRRMKSVKIVITQKVGYHATQCRRSLNQPRTGHARNRRRIHWSDCNYTTWRETTVLKVNRGELAAGETNTLNQEPVKVPPIPPSFLQGCGIIDIQYFLKVVMNPAGPARKLEVPVKIIVGTIPLKVMFDVFAQAAREAGYVPHHQGPLPSAPPTDGVDGPPPGAPPPFFADSVGGKQNIREEDDSEYMHGDKEWAPVYPYYDFSNVNSGQPDGGSSAQTDQPVPQQSMPVPTIGFQPPTPETETANEHA